MIDKYFEDYEVREEFSKEFITLWDGWLTRKNFHKLNEVTQAEWQRFNELLKELFKQFEIYKVNLNDNITQKVEKVEEIIDSYEVSMNKGEFTFTKLIIPELEAVYTEGWDYTWILWHKNNSAVESFKPLVTKSKLFSFNDNKKET